MAKTSVLPEKKVHASLMCRLDEMLTEREFDTLKKINETWEALPRRSLTKATTFVRLWDELERHGCIKVGDYSFLIEQLTDMKLMKCVKVIEEHQEKIQKSPTMASTSKASSEGLDDKMLKMIVEKVKNEITLPQSESETAPITKDGGTGKLKKTPAQGLVQTRPQEMAAPAAAAAQTRTRDVRRCRLVFEKTYTGGKFIPCIANLGNRFAVAHPVESSGCQGNRIDVFDFPDNLRLTITEHISGLYVMASTPDGKLAVLCRKGEDQCCVNTFDAETGDHVTCTPWFTLGVDPVWSFLGVGPNTFAVNCRGEYYILVLRDVTVVRQDGSVLTQHMGEECWSISCGGQFVFIYHRTPDDHIAAYEVKENHLVPVTRSEAVESRGDVSATPDEEVTVTCKRGDDWFMGRSAMRDGRFTPWQYQPITLERVGLYVPSVSVRGDHIVIMRGKTIQVFAEEGN